MQVRAVIYRPDSFSDNLYQKALTLVDSKSQARIQRFYHRADSCRTLLGRLLVRAILKERGVSPEDINFSTTAEGKPFIVNQPLNPPIAYNITHDNNLIAIAVAPGLHRPPAFSIGIDVMKLRVPGRETFRSFVDAVGDQLTDLEHRLLKGAIPESEQLKRFFWMWTLKEAYTKALGLGLGFDFKRIEFDVVERIVRVDGKVPAGWRFNMFSVVDDDDQYQGVVAEYHGGILTEVISEADNTSWLKTYDAVPFTEDAVAQVIEGSGVLKD